MILFLIIMFMYFLVISENNVYVSLDKISTVKIVSTIWLNNNQIIVCCEKNTFILYEVINGKTYF